MSLSIEVTSGDPARITADVVAVCVEQGPLNKNAWLASLEKALGGGLLAHAKHAEFEGKCEQVLDVPTLGRIKARRVVLLGLGQATDLDTARLRGTVASAVRASLGSGVSSVVVALPETSEFRTIGEAAALGAYRFVKYFTGDRRPKGELKKLTFVVPGRVTPADKKALATGVAVGDAVALARDAVNEPPNVLNPEALAAIARRIAKAERLKLKVLDKKGILAAGMHLHYAVGQGSENEPRFIHLHYAPRGAKKRLVFVGKGLTFDSGGLCIKPA
ncbi:MAG TPA: M17 family peptidase N-terminal domain-containing protein, partial [Polyangiaceae bacterium]